MMTESEQVNAILEKLGSSHRVQQGEYVSSGVMAVLEAIPAYLDAAAERAYEKRFGSPVAFHACTCGAGGFSSGCPTHGINGVCRP